MPENKQQPEMSQELADSSKEPILDNEKEKQEYKWVTPAEVRTKLDNISRDKYIELYRIMESSFNEKKLTKEQFDQTIEKIDELSEKELGYRITEWKKSNELSKEELEQTQSLYDFLNLAYNLKEHIQEKGIDLIPKEQKEALIKKGYNYSLIIPGDIERNEFLKQFKYSYAKEFNSDGIYYSTDDYINTQAAKDQSHKLRPQKPYEIMLKLPKDDKGNLLLEVRDAHPETMNQNLAQLLEMLKNQNQANPNLNLKGLTLPEYLIFLANIYHQAKQKGKSKEELVNSHPDINDWSYLLEELIVENNRPARALCSDWGPGHRGVRVDSDAVAGSSGGARFAAVSKSSS